MSWKGESRRHSLARKGIKTAKGVNVVGKTDVLYPSVQDYWHTIFPLKVFRCGDSEEKSKVRFFSDGDTAEGYCDAFGGEIYEEIITMKNPLILHSGLKNSLTKEEMKKLFKILFIDREKNYKELIKYRKEQGKYTSEWEDLEEHDLGLRIRGDGWKPIIEYAMKEGYDGIITRDTDALLTHGTVSYITWKGDN